MLFSLHFKNRRFPIQFKRNIFEKKNRIFNPGIIRDIVTP